MNKFVCVVNKTLNANTYCATTATPKCSVAVSYTHLDVYKRQGLQWAATRWRYTKRKKG